MLFFHFKQNTTFLWIDLTHLPPKVTCIFDIFHPSTETKETLSRLIGTLTTSWISQPCSSLDAHPTWAASDPALPWGPGHILAYFPILSDDSKWTWPLLPLTSHSTSLRTLSEPPSDCIMWTDFNSQTEVPSLGQGHCSISATSSQHRLSQWQAFLSPLPHLWTVELEERNWICALRCWNPAVLVL